MIISTFKSGLLPNFCANLSSAVRNKLGAGSSGGGGRAYNWGVNGQPGTANRGGGGGARWGNGSPIKGTGGSGIVIIKYKYQ